MMQERDRTVAGAVFLRGEREETEGIVSLVSDGSRAHHPLMGGRTAGVRADARRLIGLVRGEVGAPV